MNSVVMMKEPPVSQPPAFAELAREHQGMMLVYARTLLREESAARELVQEALVAAWKGLERFDVTRDVGAWLRGIIRNKWKDACRKQGREPEFAAADLEHLEDRMQQLSERPKIFEDLADCREKLPEEMKQVVSLSYDEGRGSEEVGTLLDIAATTVRKRLERARTLLRDCLQFAH